MGLHKHQTFYAVGLSYQKADAIVRGKFSMSDENRSNLLIQAKADGIESLIVTSTCNRTEMYGFADHPYQLIKLLCDNSQGTVEEFEKVSYVYKNKEAINFLFRVGTGLESQILGDFEIIAQIKNAFVESKKHQLTNSFLERLVNSVIQASKRVKTETMLSSGATSVSFASVNYILNNFSNLDDKKIVLFGTGKIGRNTCENLVKHIKNKNITLINRTKDKAEKIAGKFELLVKDYTELHQEIHETDILIVATGAMKPTIDFDVLNIKKPLLILDLSIPKNVDANVVNNPLVQLIHLDHLSQMTDETLEKRKLEIPKALEIIDEISYEFYQWAQVRKLAPTIHALKGKLNELKDSEIKYQQKKLEHFDNDFAELISSRLINKITSHFVNHLKDADTMVEESVDWIEKVFQLDAKQSS